MIIMEVCAESHLSQRDSVSLHTDSLYMKKIVYLSLHPSITGVCTGVCNCMFYKKKKRKKRKRTKKKENKNSVMLLKMFNENISSKEFGVF